MDQHSDEQKIFIGIVDEIGMRAKILRDRLKNNPEDIHQIMTNLDSLEKDTAQVLKFLSKHDAK